MVARALAARAALRGSRATAGAALTTVALLVVGLLVLWPLAAVVATGVVHLPRLGAAPLGTLGRTLALAATSTTIAVLLGLAVAYASVRAAAPGAILTTRLLLLALVLPPFLPGLAVGVIAPGTAPAATFAGLVVAQVLAFLPAAFLILGAALAAVDSDQEDVAESLGAGRLAIFARITLPQLRPGLLTAVAGVFVLCAADLANPMAAGGGYVVLSVETFASARRLDAGAGAATALWLLAPCAAAAALGGWRVRTIVAAPAARRRPRAPVRTLAAALSVVSALVALALLGVWASVLAGALAVGTTFDWAPLGRSLTLAATASVLGTVLALGIAALARGRAAGASLLEGVSLLPAAVPGIVIGLGYALAYARPPLDLGATLWLAVPALVAARLPAAVAAAGAAVRRVDPDAVAAALSLGAGRRRAFSRAVAPGLAPAATSILAALFARALVAVSVVAWLAEPRDRLAAVTAVLDAAGGRLGDACVLAAVVSMVVLIVVALRRLLSGPEHAAVWFL